MDIFKLSISIPSPIQVIQIQSKKISVHVRRKSNDAAAFKETELSRKAIADTAPEIESIDSIAYEDTWFDECIELSKETPVIESGQMEANLQEAFDYLAGKKGRLFYIIGHKLQDYRFDITYDHIAPVATLIVHFSKDMQARQTQFAFTAMKLQYRNWFLRILGLKKHKDMPYGDLEKPGYYSKGGIFLISDFIGLTTYQRPEDAINTIKDTNQRPDYHDLFLTQMMTLHSRIKEELNKT